VTENSVNVNVPRSRRACPSSPRSSCRPDPKSDLLLGIKQDYIITRALEQSRNGCRVHKLPAVHGTFILTKHSNNITTLIRIAEKGRRKEKDTFPSNEHVIQQWDFGWHFNPDYSLPRPRLFDNVYQPPVISLLCVFVSPALSALPSINKQGLNSLNPGLCYYV